MSMKRLHVPMLTVQPWLDGSLTQRFSEILIAPVNRPAKAGRLLNHKSVLFFRHFRHFLQRPYNQYVTSDGTGDGRVTEGDGKKNASVTSSVTSYVQNIN